MSLRVVSFAVQNKTQGVPSTYGPYAIAICAMNLELRDFISFGAQSHYLTISYCHGQVNYNISVHNVKQMTTAAETDAFRICGPVSGITVHARTEHSGNQRELLPPYQCSPLLAHVLIAVNMVVRPSVLQQRR